MTLAALALATLLSTPAPVAPEQAPTPSPEELLQQVESLGMQEREKPFEVAAAIGKLYWNADRRDQALPYLEEAVKRAAPLRARYLKLRKKAFAARTPPAPKCESSPPTLAEAEARAEKWKLPEALTCLRTALQPALEVQTLLGHGHHLAGRADEALAAYASVLEVVDAFDEALFGEGVLLLEHRGDDARSLDRARDDFERYVQRYPSSPRVDRARMLMARAQAAKNAGGLSKLVTPK